MSNRDFEEWFMKEIADDDGDYNKPVYEAAKWAWQARVPEGYVVVPCNQTEEMWGGFANDYDKGFSDCAASLLDGINHITGADK